MASAASLMSTWTRIGDDDRALFGKKLIFFPLDATIYRVEVDDIDQDHILLTYQGISNRWDVYYKEVDNEVFRLSGMTYGRGDPFDGVLWFELTLGARATMRFWGDRVILHEHLEVLPLR